MATTRSAKRAQQPARRPELKLGPFHAGLGIAVWLNKVETPDGDKFFRSISIAPRRYREKETGKWKDAVSYRPVDLPVLQLALEKAHAYCLSTPLPGQPAEDEDIENVLEDGEIVHNSQPTA